MLEIDEEYLKDAFNTHGLQKDIPKEKLKACLKMILSPYAPAEEDLNDEQFLELN